MQTVKVLTADRRIVNIPVTPNMEAFLSALSLVLSKRDSVYVFECDLVAWENGSRNPR